MRYYTKEWYQNGCPQLTVPDSSFGTLPPWYRDFSVHDCRVLSRLPAEPRGAELVLHLDNAGAFTSCTVLRFEDYILKEACNTENAFCIADELYHKENGRYEYHLLLQQFPKSGRPQLDYLTINCKSITPVALDL